MMYFWLYKVVATAKLLKKSGLTQNFEGTNNFQRRDTGQDHLTLMRSDLIKDGDAGAEIGVFRKSCAYMLNCQGIQILACRIRQNFLISA